MTTVIILMFGAGAILVISGISSDSQGNSPSIYATLLEIWNGGTPPNEGKTTGAGEQAGSTKTTAPPASGTATERTHAAAYWLSQRGY